MAQRSATQLVSNEADIQLAISSINTKQVKTGRIAADNVFYKRAAHASESPTPPTLRTSTDVYLNNAIV
jgi:hypothetical protein